MLPIWLLAAMMIMMYHWRFWEPWANAMLAILLPKLWFGLKIMTGTTVFACLPGARPYWTQKSFIQNKQFYIIDWIREKTPGRCCQSGSLLPWWLAHLFLHVFLGLTLIGHKKASKRTVLHNRLNKEKFPGRCCQSGSLLPWWLWCTIGGFGNPGQMLC